MNNVSGRLILTLGFGCFLLCPVLWGFSLLMFRNLIFFLALSFISVSDLTEHKIPDKVILISLSAWVFYVLSILCFGKFLTMSPDVLFLMNASEMIKDGVVSAFLFAFGIYFAAFFLKMFLKKKALGGGDIKLFFLAGLYLGLTKSLYMLFLACIIGLLISLISGKKKIPFGPAISLAAAVLIIT